MTNTKRIGQKRAVKAARIERRRAIKNRKKIVQLKKQGLLFQE